MSNLILASNSLARQTMLKNAGYGFNIIPAKIDEQAIQIDMMATNKSPIEIVIKLAEEKALSVSHEKKDNMIIGSDQILVMDNKIYSKAESFEEARKRLSEFNGREHTLISAVCLAKNGEILWRHYDQATLKMKSFSELFLERYIDLSKDILTTCVGCYALEGVGIRLFDHIEGDYFTILGMPLLPLIKELDNKGFGINT